MADSAARDRIELAGWTTFPGLGGAGCSRRIENGTLVQYAASTWAKLEHTVSIFDAAAREREFLASRVRIDELLNKSNRRSNRLSETISNAERR